MAIWKHYIVLFGGFYDPGYRSMSLAWDLLLHIALTSIQSPVFK